MRFAVLEGSLEARAVLPRIRTLAIRSSFNEIPHVAIGSSCLALSLGQFGFVVTIALIVTSEVHVAHHSSAMCHRGRGGNDQDRETDQLHRTQSHDLLQSVNGT